MKFRCDPKKPFQQIYIPSNHFQIELIDGFSSVPEFPLSAVFAPLPLLPPDHTTELGYP